MNNKYTFIELCETYQKIEIPIIQRDYAQGRETDEVKRIKNNFINEFLIPSVLKNTAIELDFVYGSILTEVKGDLKIKTFIPLDGQQRLTTLFLLHYFIGIKENRLHELKSTLEKFTYETRPSAHDFCKRLLDFDNVLNLATIRAEIEDSEWFNEEWLNDPTVAGMLKIIDTFASNKLLRDNDKTLVNRLLDKENKLISFYFTDLEQFGLTESLYIRMNARGKMLTDFENFKSEFFKVIRYNHSLLEQVKDKIEYQWVDNLWDYRGVDIYVIDKPFMKYLSFITEMLYYKDAEFRSTKPYETNFLNFKVLNDIYSKEDNLKFLIFSLDYISSLKQIEYGLLWNGDKLISLEEILKDIIEGSNDIDKHIILYSSLIHGQFNKPIDNLKDYLRVVRNLTVNTADNSRREWPRLLASVETISKDLNVYELLAKSTEEINLTGFNVNQRKEEIFKSKLILDFPEIKSLLFRIEDHVNFKGNITNILITPFVNTEEEFTKSSLDSCLYDGQNFVALHQLFEAYEEISKNDFNPIWGNLLNSGLYELVYDSRLVYSGDFKDHPAVLIFAKNYLVSKISLIDYIKEVQRGFVNWLEETYEDFGLIRNVKEQLYLYYIINEQVYEQPYNSFFRNGNFNFGWLSKDSGYKSHFSQGIEGCKYFPQHNPIFQLYNSQFRYNSGLNESNALHIEIVGGGKKRNPFELIKEWANTQ
ncbi:DUF262 domain-containing protein [Pedobacter agri]|uniref:DUF262 domain-containing protein n=1 Tax=Pedobacter agri TaxID=454586 RepID=UPI002930164C|nr:DUF262 domain-containing protein [Pedobacter agri]